MVRRMKNAAPALIVWLLAAACDTGPRTIPIDPSEVVDSDVTAAEDSGIPAELQCTEAAQCDQLAGNNKCVSFQCLSGQCVVQTSSTKDCTECERCVPATGACEPLEDGDTCSVAGSCLTGQTCQSGECSGGVTDCADAECADLVPSCKTPDCGNFVIGCENVHAYALSANLVDTVFSKYDCTTEEFPGPAAVYEIVVAEAGPIEIGISTLNQADLELLLLEGAVCASNTCVDHTGAPGKITRQVQVGDILHVVVEARGDVVGSYELSVSCDPDAECKPYCPNGALCGTDGCGGSCGDCAGDLTCVDGACVTKPPNDTCESATLLDTLPAQVSGDTFAAGDDYHQNGGACGISYTAGKGNDVVFSFVPQTSGPYIAEMLDAGFASMLAIVDSCGDGLVDGEGCLASLDELEAKGGLKVSANLDSGKQYFVIVDGMGSATDNASVPVTGSFELSVRAATCDAAVPNYTIEDADLPFSWPASGPEGSIGSTAGQPSIWSVPKGGWCGENAPGGTFGDAREFVFAYTPQSTVDLVLTLNATGENWDSTIWVTTCLDAPMAACVGAADNIGTSGEQLNVTLEADTTYWIVVDGFDGSEGGFQLDVSQCLETCEGKVCGDNGCGGSCGECADGSACGPFGTCLVGADHDTCDAPMIIKEVGTYWGNTDGGTDAVSPPAQTVENKSCYVPNWEAESSAPDDVIEFEAPKDARYQFKIGVDTTFNAGLWVSSSCVESSGGCLMAGEGNAPDGSDEVFATLTDGQIVWVFVDGVITGKGVYTLEISECLTACEGKQCGDDGCGGTCGTCDDGFACNADALCESTAGLNDTCETALEIPFAAADEQWVTTELVDSTTASDDYQNDNGEGLAVCGDADLTEPNGAGAGDLVYKLTAPEKAEFQITLTSATFDTSLYIVHGTGPEACADLQTNCVEDDDALGQNGGEIVSVSMETGQSIWIIVDGSQPGGKGLFELTITKATTILPPG